MYDRTNSLRISYVVAPQFVEEIKKVRDFFFYEIKLSVWGCMQRCFLRFPNDFFQIANAKAA